MLVRGGSIAIVEAFDTETFWDTVRKTGATTTTLLGAMISFLMKAKPTPRDRDHTLRQAVMVPLAEDAAEFTAAIRCRHLHGLQHDRDFLPHPCRKRTRMSPRRAAACAPVLKRASLTKTTWRRRTEPSAS